VSFVNYLRFNFSGNWDERGDSRVSGGVERRAAAHGFL
jgi:hypothetical protein